MSIINKIIRIAVFACGLVSVTDGGLPSVMEEVHVSAHSSDTDNRIYFSDAKTDSCKLGRTSYDVLQDGDAVTLRSSRLLHHCIELRRGDDIILKSRWWKLGCLITGIMLMLSAIFWKAGEDDDGEGSFSMEFELD